MSKKEEVTFAINGRIFHVNPSTVNPDTTLNAFIRHNAMLKGTKYMCGEGGCGVCLVTMQFTHPVTKKDQFCAINSCLMPILACHGTSITTVEGIGNSQQGYHEIQESIANGNGTQCGYCSPGMVMTVYSSLKCNPNITRMELEKSFCGNSCRCTGYRPIVQSANSVLSKLRNRCAEDSQKSFDDTEMKLNRTRCPSSNEGSPKPKYCYEESNVLDFVELALVSNSVHLDFKAADTKWFKVGSVFEIMQIFDLIGKNPCVLVAGNTSRGIYPQSLAPAAYIDVRGVKELQQYSKFKSKLVLGANMTLADTISTFRKTANGDGSMFGYLNVLADHLSLIANVAIRNRIDLLLAPAQTIGQTLVVGTTGDVSAKILRQKGSKVAKARKASEYKQKVATLAGNLRMKRDHQDFVSDVFMVLELAGARIKINEHRGSIRIVSMLEFLHVNMNKTLIVSIELPGISSSHYVMKTYKVMPRKQNAFSLLSAGFLFRLLKDNKIVEEKPKIILAGINRNFVHAANTESVLKGKKLLDASVVLEATNTLSQEVQPDSNALSPSPEYRKRLACSLLYKFILNIGGAEVQECYRNGSEMLVRPLSSSMQDFHSSGDFTPVGQPVQKLEALKQCSGEAEYVDDIPRFPNELFATLVLAEEAAATIHSVDPTKALDENGIVAFFGADDIPGINSFGNIPPFLPEDEEIFCSGQVSHSGQPVGVLVGESVECLKKAARKVEIKYLTEGEPVFTIKDVIQSGQTSRVLLQSNIQATETKENIKYEIEGEFELGSQCHYAMELICVLVVPTDHGFKVFPTSQWIQSVQTAIAQCLNIPENAIEIEVKRIGGGFGGKMTRVGQIAAACALAAHKLRAPVRLTLDLETTAKFLGKRCPLLTKYKASVDENGSIQKLTADLYEDYGVSMNDPLDEEALHGFQNFYNFNTWTVNIYAVRTDNIRTYTRGPGSLEGLASIEHIMDHIAEITGKDPTSVRLANATAEDLPQIAEIIDTLKASSEYDTRTRAVEDNNKENRWRKRGIAMVPMKFLISFAPSYYGMVAVFPGDGSVAITTGGIEMGQGVNTKAAQVCAFALGIGLDQIRVVSSRSMTSPGNFPSGSSLTSDSICSAVMSCCKQLKERFKPVEDKIGSPDWLQIVKAANMEGLSLVASHCYSPSESTPNDYPVYGATVLEVEVDVLTGQYQVLRADILEDAGESLNPAVDIGQIEGGFVMGLGYFSSENVISDPKTGSTLTCSSKNYHVPGAMDVPADFRVALRKNSPNPLGVLRSKATGEPPLCMSCVLLPALRQAISSARKDAGVEENRFEYGQPCTFEKTLLACGTNNSEFKI